jgi:hypothetical protein
LQLTLKPPHYQIEACLLERYKSKYLFNMLSHFNDLIFGKKRPWGTELEGVLGSPGGDGYSSAPEGPRISSPLPRTSGRQSSLSIRSEAYFQRSPSVHFDQNQNAPDETSSERGSVSEYSDEMVDSLEPPNGFRFHQLTCPLCNKLMTSNMAPVQLRCEHSYCRKCIDKMPVFPENATLLSSPLLQRR